MVLRTIKKLRGVFCRASPCTRKSSNNTNNKFRFTFINHEHKAEHYFIAKQV
jgi:hypothetical protein